MFTHIVPIGGYNWEDGTKVAVKSEINDEGVVKFRYEWVSDYCMENYQYQIPCKRRVERFDNLMHILEVQLTQFTRFAKSTGTEIFANSTRKQMQHDIERFEEDCKKEKHFY